MYEVQGIIIRKENAHLSMLMDLVNRLNISIMELKPTVVDEIAGQGDAYIQVAEPFIGYDADEPRPVISLIIQNVTIDDPGDE